MLVDGWYESFTAWEAGDNQNESLFGEAGNDLLVSYDGRDTLDGGADNDELFALGDFAVMNGGSGSNDFYIASGEATMNGGTGMDAFMIYEGGATINGGGGENRIAINPEAFAEVNSGDGLIKIGDEVLSGTFYRENDSSSFCVVGDGWLAYNSGAYLDVWNVSNAGFTLRINGWTDGKYGISLSNDTSTGGEEFNPIVQLYDDPYNQLFVGVDNRIVDITKLREAEVYNRTALEQKEGSASNDIMNGTAGDQNFTGLAGKAQSGVDARSIEWLYGAAEVNKGIGDFSKFIREYTKTQSDIRFKTKPTDAQIQTVSDNIAKAVITDALAMNGIPSLTQIGSKDANTVATSFFKGDKAGWSGNMLFVGLGEGANDNPIPLKNIA
jgi:RTX calcium-binding nonapeptide repeat (4 copies)